MLAWEMIDDYAGHDTIYGSNHWRNSTSLSQAEGLQLGGSFGPGNAYIELLGKFQGASIKGELIISDTVGRIAYISGFRKIHPQH